MSKDTTQISYLRKFFINILIKNMATEKTKELRQAVTAAAQMLQRRSDPDIAATHRRLQQEYLQSLGKAAKPTNSIQVRK